MLRLKEVVDKQRDEIRAQAHEIVCKNHDTEAVRGRVPLAYSSAVRVGEPCYVICSCTHRCPPVICAKVFCYKSRLFLYRFLYHPQHCSI